MTEQMEEERFEAVRPVVAIDGPAGSGKSSIARRVAAAIGVPHIDSGAVYRAAALACLREGVDLTDPVACADLVTAARIEPDAGSGRTLLDGSDVEDEIRGAAVTAAVSAVSAHPGVRAAVTPSLRAAAADGGVMEGRDIGTVVLPDADVKIFLTASVEERARRRGLQVGRADFDEIGVEITARDQADASRAISPLRPAEDAWVLVTDGLAVDDVVAAIVARVADAMGGVAPEVAADAPTDAIASGEPADPVTARAGLPRVAIVGRPNVGKSTLVNRILGRRITIVEEKPGVTRDRTEHLADWAGLPFLVIDTGGWEHGATGMTARVVEQAERAVAAADVVLFVVDATVGALEDDERYARILRRSGIPTLLVANKVDGPRQEALAHELYALGLGQPHAISARHGRGVGDLLDAVVTHFPAEHPTAGVIADDGIPRVAVVGRPNVGKSSLFNRLLGEERSIVDALPHTTRDAVDTMLHIDEEPWIFIDTAGMRRRYRHGEDTELFSVDRTRAAIEQADLVLFLIDASQQLGEQDQRLASLLRDAGCGIILVCNKWDLVDDDRRLMLDKELDRLLSFADWAPRVNVSATTGRGVRRLLPQLRTVWRNFRRRIPTRELNRVLGEVVARHPPPRRGNRALKLRYVTQAETGPPRFMLFGNGSFPPDYKRYLERELRARYEFGGVPLMLDDRPTRRARARGSR